MQVIEELCPYKDIKGLTLSKISKSHNSIFSLIIPTIPICPHSNLPPSTILKLVSNHSKQTGKEFRIIS